MSTTMNVKRMATGLLTLAAIGGAVAGGVVLTRASDATDTVLLVPIDAAVDAAVDAAPDSSIDAPLSVEWEMETLASNASTGLTGADGVDFVTIDGDLIVISPWEGSGTITVSTKEGSSVSTVMLSTVTSSEDAKFGDIDQDGHYDICAGGQGKRIRCWTGQQLASRNFTGEADNDTLTSTAHGWTTGDQLTVANSGGALPTGVVVSTDYYVILVDANNFKLATSFANALASTAIDLTTDGTGTQTATSAVRWANTRSFDIDAATNLQQWMQLAFTSTGGVRVWATGRGTSNKTFTAEADDDTITSTAHALRTGDTIRVTNSGGALPSGLVISTNYWVIRVDDNSYKLATTQVNAVADVAIDLTTDGTGTQTATRQSSVGYFSISGSARVSSNYTWNPIHPVTWPMSLLPGDWDADGDIDVVVSDRQNGHGNKGTRLFRFSPGPTWTRVTIYASNAEGDVKFAEIVGTDTIYVGMSSTTFANKVVKTVATTSDWTTFTTTTVAPYPSDVGQYQDITLCDLTGDGVDDRIYTHAPPPHSLTCSLSTHLCEGIVAVDGGTGDRINIEQNIPNITVGESLKYDDVRCLDWDLDGDQDLLTSEQNKGFGVFVLVNPLCPAAGLSAGCTP